MKTTLHRLLFGSLLGFGLLTTATAQTAPSAQPAPAPVPAARPVTPDVVAQVMAGIAPAAGDPRIDRLVNSDEWRTHRDWVKERWAEVNPRLESMRRWRAAEVPQADAATRTLLYPFSGPDFLNADAMFPTHPRLVFFSLERPGQLPDLTRLDATQFARLLADVRYALSDIFERNYFITSYMTRQLTSPYVKGTVPVMAIMMALTGNSIRSVTPLDPFPDLSRQYLAPPDAHATTQARRKPRIPLRGVRIEFARAGGPVRSLDYYSLDATDKELRWYPQFLEHVTSARPATAFIKSASYLLHDNQFAGTRDALLKAADIIVQDDTGVPYRVFKREGWAVRLYGVYTEPVAPLGYAAQPDLEAAYAAAAPVPTVDFPIGYSGQKGRPSLLVARRGK